MDNTLGQVHPTFDAHQRVGESAVRFFEEAQETAPIRLAQLAFKQADEQLRLTKIERVVIEMKISTEQPIFSHGNNAQFACRVTLDRTQYEQSQNGLLSHSLPGDLHRVYIALGSNIGDRVGNIESACEQMRIRGIKVIRTSALYETKAMYLEDQQCFINGVCEVRYERREDQLPQTDTTVFRF